MPPNRVTISRRRRPAGRLALLLLVALMPLLSMRPAAAATVERIAQNPMGCILRIDGEIAQGDAARLQAALERIAYTFSPTPDGERICLNSAGGSLVEAVKMGDLIARLDFGTAVEAGATCESACAIIFMSGRFSHPEAEGNFVPDRVLHPRGRLGFHAPALVVGEGNYSKLEVNRAYAVALSSMGEIVRLRSERRNRLADSLLLTILTTPPGDMTHVETVGQAARWRIDVAPVALPQGDPTGAVLNACDNADAGLLDIEPVARRAFGPGGGPEVRFTAGDTGGGTATTTGGYRTEAAANCRIVLFADAGAVDRLGYLTIEGGSSNEDTRVEVYPHLFHPPERRLAELPPPTDAGGIGAFLSSFATADRTRLRSVPIDGCFLRKARARVVNVRNFVNLRRAPGFEAPVLREVPLGEEVTLPEVARYFPFGSEAAVADCRDRCGRAARSPWDTALKAQAQRCVNDHGIWYRIRDARGNLGFVSRKYLDDGG